MTHAGVAEASGDAAMQLLIALDQGWDGHLMKLRSILSDVNRAPIT